MRAVGVSLALGAAVALAISGSASPTPPGRNGLIAFVGMSGNAAQGIRVMHADGSGLRAITRDGLDASPAWSPHGAFLAFERRGAIYVINVDGTRLRRLTRPRPASREPAWSPDGRSIAFVRQGSLWFMRADGLHARRIYRPLDAVIEEPSWSPDGQRIVVNWVDSSPPNGQESGSITVIERDGSQTTDVTDIWLDPGPSAQPADWANDSDPDWSPDGTRIAFTRTVWLCERCDQAEVFSANVDGSDVRWVTPDRSYASSNPSWSPNGRRFVAETSKGITIFGPGGDMIKVISTAGSDPAWQPR
jgi:Tol biopolymer transport system component